MISNTESVNESYYQSINLYKAGKLNEAATLCKNIIIKYASYPGAFQLLGVIAFQSKQLKRAVVLTSRSLYLNPNDTNSYTNLALVFSQLHKSEQAIQCSRAVLSLQPGFAEAWNNLGHALQNASRRHEASQCFQHAIRVFPDLAEPYANLANILRLTGQYCDAKRVIQCALTLKPDMVESHSHLGSIEYDLNESATAERSFRRAITLKADFWEAHFLLGKVLLSGERYEEGLALYEARWEVLAPTAQHILSMAPRWNGENLSGQTLLIHAEQGLGDTLQFCRYLPHVIARGGTVIMEAPASMHALLQGLAPSCQFVTKGEPLPEFTCHSPLLSLPYLLRTRVETILWQVPYLTAHHDIERCWSEKLTASRGKRIGVVWRSNPDHPRYHLKSIPPQILAAAFQAIDVTLISLQIDANLEELTCFRSETSLVIDAGPDLIDFSQTAAILANLDLVVSVDSAVCHLAGAMGVKIWTLLDSAPDWRWRRDGESVVWYPTMRLFRQDHPGHWDKAVSQLADALRELIQDP